MAKVLKKEFFNRDTATVAQELLGKFLVRKIGRKEFAAMVTETEAYDGPHDLASHAFKGKTKRTEIMFGQPGNFYVYLVYGMHYMLNAVTREKDYPAAVLIRGVKGINGPGRVTKRLKIDKRFNNKPANKKVGLWIESASWRSGIKINKRAIKRLPRVGVDYSGLWAKKPLRFLLK